LSADLAHSMPLSQTWGGFSTLTFLYFIEVSCMCAMRDIWTPPLQHLSKPDIWTPPCFPSQVARRGWGRGGWVTATPPPLCLQAYQASPTISLQWCTRPPALVEKFNYIRSLQNYHVSMNSSVLLL
jgi:hypothetical protein